MKFSIFKSPKAQIGELCTYEKFLEVTTSQQVIDLCKRIAAEEDKEERGRLKAMLPVITWQAYFEGKRLAKEAQPSGLFMLDIDHVDGPYEIWSQNIAPWKDKWGVVFCGMTASQHGLRVVAKCRPEYDTIEECQRWLAAQIGVEFDGVCKDFARCSFVVADNYTYYMDGRLFTEEPAEGTLYRVDAVRPYQVTMQMPTGHASTEQAPTEPLTDEEKKYKGIPYSTIAVEWLEATGGEPTDGARNTRLFKLVTRMRYITDFDEGKLLAIMPRYGLPEWEMRSLIHSAVSSARAQDMPRDLADVLDNIDRRIKLGEDSDGYELGDIITDDTKMPHLPPLIRQWVDVAPEDFKKAVALCNLPILGALGSKLRARYLDGEMHSPTFNVSLEAPQASGKSFLTKLCEYNLAQMIEADENQRQKEREYSERAAEMKMLNIKVTVDNKEEILGTKPKGIIRYVPATMSITKLLMRMSDAQGLHLFAFSPEVDTVYKAFKRGFSSYSDALRVSFENGLYGQDYASENSFSGNVRLYYNTLFSGTPKAMRRFYPDVEDGLVSRVLFCTLPDQFGKEMPVWSEFTSEQRQIVDVQLVRLSDISLQGSDVQPDHVMKMDWVNTSLKQWIITQQQRAIKDDDRTRDIFCRRSAVVGFRAAMLAWFLYGEKGTPTIRRNVSEFAIWVANCMLNQHLLRFNITSTNSNTMHFADAFAMLGDEFTHKDLDSALAKCGVATAPRKVLYNWRLGGYIEPVGEKAVGENGGARTFQKFKKISK